MSDEMNDLVLKDNPTLRDFQEYVKRLELQRGFANQSAIEKCLLLGEEMGELFKAIRKATKLKTDINANIGSINEEIADMVIYLCSIANRFEIDMERAFREKEEINKNRKWI
jgi:NTP pyrophosphatase (non-canonical NTP hydrolase)